MNRSRLLEDAMVIRGSLDLTEVLFGAGSGDADAMREQWIVLGDAGGGDNRQKPKLLVAMAFKRGTVWIPTKPGCCAVRGTLHGAALSCLRCCCSQQVVRVGGYLHRASCLV